MSDRLRQIAEILHAARATRTLGGSSRLAGSAMARVKARRQQASGIRPGSGYGGDSRISRMGGGGSRVGTTATGPTNTATEGLEPEAVDMLAGIVDGLSMRGRMALIERLRERRGRG